MQARRVEKTECAVSTVKGGCVRAGTSRKWWVRRERGGWVGASRAGWAGGCVVSGVGGWVCRGEDRVAPARAAGRSQLCPRIAPPPKNRPPCFEKRPPRRPPAAWAAAAAAAPPAKRGTRGPPGRCRPLRRWRQTRAGGEGERVGGAPGSAAAHAWAARWAGWMPPLLLAPPRAKPVRLLTRHAKPPHYRPPFATNPRLRRHPPTREDAALARNVLRGVDVVAGDHAHGDARPLAGGHCGGHLLAHRVLSHEREGGAGTAS